MSPCLISGYIWFVCYIFARLPKQAELVCHEFIFNSKRLVADRRKGTCACKMFCSESPLIAHWLPSSLTPKCPKFTRSVKYSSRFMCHWWCVTSQWKSSISASAPEDQCAEQCSQFRTYTTNVLPCTIFKYTACTPTANRGASHLARLGAMMRMLLNYLFLHPSHRLIGQHDSLSAWLRTEACVSLIS